MVEKFVKQVEFIEGPKIDLKLLRKRGNYKTCSGIMLSDMQKFRKDGNFEMAQYCQEKYKQMFDIEKKERIELKGWKGKSGIKLIRKPDSFIVITYQKADKDSKPHEIKREVTKIEINRVISTINHLNHGKRIRTRDIGEFVYNKSWDEVFSDRFKHTQLNFCLRILEYYGLIKYSGGLSQVIKEVREIQELC